MSRATPKARRRRKQRKKIYDVRVWPSWIVVALSWLIAHLPLRLLAWLAQGLGALVYRVGHARRAITLKNLERCFPELDAEAREKLARASFIHTAMGAIEAMRVWLGPKGDIAERTVVQGAANFLRARAEGRGVVIIGGHFSALDILGPSMESLDVDVMYRENKNPVWEWLQVRGRRRYFEAVIEREDVRQTLRRLKAGRGIWYAADQDYGARHSVFAPFFGIQAASVTATARLAAYNNSPVLLVTHYRNLKDLTWEVRISPPLTNYPTGEAVADASRINDLIETAIRKHPEQYLWMHRRFKTRPPGDAPFYR
ncbi:MAG: lipid A biosynthesis acyltransferase [Pseudomonadota bacterium]